MQTIFVQSFSTTLRVMDVRAENRGRLHQKVRFPVAPLVGEKLFDPGASSGRVRNVRGKSGPKSLCLCCFFLPWLAQRINLTRLFRPPKINLPTYIFKCVCMVMRPVSDVIWRRTNVQQLTCEMVWSFSLFSLKKGLNLKKSPGGESVEKYVKKCRIDFAL